MTLSLMLMLIGTPLARAGLQTTAPKLCDEVVTTLYPEWRSKLPRHKLRRVDVRNCRVGDWGVLQIAAWREGGGEPALVVDTDRTTIVKLAMAGNVFVLETAGASSNVVQAVVYENGIPRLALRDAIKAYAHIEVNWKKVVLGLPQEKGPERVYEFPTGAN
jgi:hypothetical protein